VVDWLEALERAEEKRITHNTPPSIDDSLEEEHSNASGVRTDKTDKRVPDSETLRRETVSERFPICKKHHARDCEPCYRELDRVVDQGMKPRSAMEEIYFKEE
jgi:hypothetical protein